MAQNFFPTIADTERVKQHEDANQTLRPEARDIFWA